MISLLQAIVDVVTSLVNFVINTITSLMALLIHIPTYTSFLIGSLSVLPTLVYPFAVASISIYVIFLVLNRGK